MPSIIQTWLNRTGHEENIYAHLLYGALLGLPELASCMGFTVQAAIVESRSFTAVGTRARGFNSYALPGFKDSAMPTACKEPYRPPALQPMWAG